MKNNKVKQQLINFIRGSKNKNIKEDTNDTTLHNEYPNTSKVSVDEKNELEAIDTILNQEEISLKNILNGKIIQLSEVDDVTFAEGIMGKGIAFVPDSNKIYAPCDGEVVTVFKTKHAVLIRSVDGVEILLHIGLDTVNLNGKYFRSHVSDGQMVTQGTLLVEFESKKIKGENYDLTTVLVVLNSAEYSKINPIENKDYLEYGQEVIKIVR